MRPTITNLWIYLARRDKKGIKLVVTLQARAVLPSRLPNPADLRLPYGISQKIEKIVKENKMLWELWMESADNFSDLRESLKKRGYTELPVVNQPLIIPTASIEINSGLLPQNKTMLR